MRAVAEKASGPPILPFGNEEERTAVVGDVATHLRAGGWIAYPTETVYGFGCALVQPTLRALATAKRRAGERPFLLLVPEGWMSDALLWTIEARRLVAAFWPGPLTLALVARPGSFPAEVTAPDGTVAIRCSSHPAAAAILGALDAPLTSTSANVPGALPARDATGAAAAAQQLGLPTQPWILDGGVLGQSLASTLVRVTDHGVRIVRQGAIGTEAIRMVLGEADVQ
jgi:L-threonylcarbamoyladenylate synthase